MAKIKEITAREILNAKGLPTIEATVVLNDGKVGVASCSTEEDSLAAINIINKIIAPTLVGKEASIQQDIDRAMIDLDATANKSKLGANTMLSVSIAVAKASAESSVLPLFLYLRQFIKRDNGSLRIPIPIFNLIRGIRKEGSPSDFNEFLLIPATSKTYTESIQIGELIHKSLKKILENKVGGELSDYDEGYAPNLSSNKEAFFLLQQAAEEAHIRMGFDVFLGLDSKASLFFKDGKYRVKYIPTALSAQELTSYYEELNKNMHLLYLEDPLAQDDWEGWSFLFGKMSETSIIAGGDLISTNPYKLQIALEKKTINGIVIKPSQAGTVIECLAIAQAAQETGLKIIVSHRGVETNDDFLSDFSVAVAADYIRIGSLARGENIAKYNRLLQIESQLRIL